MQRSTLASTEETLNFRSNHVGYFFISIAQYDVSLYNMMYMGNPANI